MLFYTIGQSRVFLALLVSGLMLGAWYDITRALKALMDAGRALGAFLDFVCALGACALLAISLLIANRLELRLYALMGAACGACLYMCLIAPALASIGRILRKLGAKIGHIHVLKQIFRFFSK